LHQDTETRALQFETTRNTETQEIGWKKPYLRIRKVLRQESDQNNQAKSKQKKIHDSLVQGNMVKLDLTKQFPWSHCKIRQTVTMNLATREVKHCWRKWDQK